MPEPRLIDGTIPNDSHAKYFAETKKTDELPDSLAKNDCRVTKNGYAMRTHDCAFVKNPVLLICSVLLTCPVPPTCLIGRWNVNPLNAPQCVNRWIVLWSDFARLNFANASDPQIAYVPLKNVRPLNAPRIGHVNPCFGTGPAPLSQTQT